MGKSKKIKKGSKEEEGESDAEIEVTETNKESSVKSNKTKAKLKIEETIVSDEEEGVKSNKKKNKKTKDEKVATVTKDMKKMEIGNKKASKKPVVSDDDDSDSASEPESKVKKPQTGFSLLMDDSEESHHSSDDQNDDDDDEEEDKPKVVHHKPPPQKETQQSGKKGKKSKKKKADSDDDIDKVLAELELEYSGKKPAPVSEVAEINLENKKDSEQNDLDESTVKTAAQKKKEKKEREKMKKQAAKQQELTAKEDEPVKESTPIPEPEVSEEASKQEGADGEQGEDVGDKKKKKKKGEKEKADDKSKKPAKKTIAAMQEALKKIKEEEERLQHEEEERIKQEEERENQRLEQIRIEKEKKDKKKLKEKERKDRLKAEGKFLTPKQKADKARALAMIESLKIQGGGVEVEKKTPRLGTRIKPNKVKKQTSEEQTAEQEGANVELESLDTKDDAKKSDTKKQELVKDSWDAETSSSDNEDEEEEKPITTTPMKPVILKSVPSKKDSPMEQKKEDSSTEESDTETESDSSEDEEDSRLKVQERQKALMRMKKREEENEAKQSESVMRAAIVCVLGHVDTGKTKILDKLRRTNVQDGEAGGITQQIGATNVPIENIKEQTKHIKGVGSISFKIPGLLIIDTPGHESFSNLRSRGSSLCDIAILVVDIMHGLEPQTKESINLLKARKTPFVVALNKIDRLYDWQSMQRKDIKDIIKAQHVHTQNEFDTRTKEVILQFANEGLNAALFYENPDPRSYVSLVPTSAITGEGMGNLLGLIIQLCENMLHKKLLFSETLQATVLEVKAIPGLGTTIDAILINGRLRETDTIVLAGTDGPIVTQIRSLLMPQPMKELRVKNAYIEYKEIVAAQGVKIAAKDLEKAVAGLNLLVAHKPDEVEILKEEVSKDLKSALSSIKLSERGVYVQASTLGSLEALLEFLKSSSIPYSAIRIGPVVKRDVMKASAMLEHESQYAVILAFDVKIERDAQELADSLGVTIFQADIIYHLFDKFMAHRNALKARKREEFKHIAVFPCKLRVLPQFVFNSRDPIVVGVIIEAGIVKEGTPICVPSKEFVELGVVSSIENNHKQVETARKGMEVCIKIDPIPGESPKMFGRHFDETDFLVSKISRASIDACKDYFRDDLVKTDWQLMVELRNLFQIL